MSDSVEKVGFDFYGIKYAFEIEIRMLSRRFGLRFDVAACKNGVFTTQCMARQAGSTFSTQSVVLCRSRPQSVLAKPDAIGGHNECKRVVKWSAISHLFATLTNLNSLAAYD